ncbi:hypothetical protein HYH03_006773 [Edaphochlamys debaryana]|uniref:Uncharacterized protein n=1 Tax=Edaphochlamys debaryana TaxID=47281 RepID=A0A835Y3A4_9CHLO|nr:hypothetical protein HYH03_006773 [Edaphochlamys debaryana]|eukprot:KAG2495166.1 hypothetical protein HYH03_006773 [Edaphochlamys debaryana]
MHRKLLRDVRRRSLGHTVACCFATFPLRSLLAASLLGLASFVAGGTDGASGSRTCGDFCTVGKVQGYHGPLDTAAELKEALSRVAYGKEVILLAETRVDLAAQAVWRYTSAGYGHVLSIMPPATPAAMSFEPCALVAQAVAAGPWEAGGAPGNVSCGWYRLDKATWQYELGEIPLASRAWFLFQRRPFGPGSWWVRWHTTARAVALGYNVLSVQSDTVPLGDFYGLVKSPPLARYRMFATADCPSCISPPLVYVQGAAADGPIAWLLYDAVQRSVRFAENSSAVEALTRASPDLVGTWIQEEGSLLTDALRSCLAHKNVPGTPRPQFPGTLEVLLIPQGAKANAVYDRMGGWEIYSKMLLDLAKTGFRTETVKLAPPLAERVWPEGYPEAEGGNGADGREVDMWIGELRMPHTGGVWPMKFGGNPYAAAGPLTQAYRQSYKDLGVPLPPDPEDPAAAARANATAPELIALLGYKSYAGWLSEKFSSHGRLGLWHSHLKPPFSPAIGHMGRHPWEGVEDFTLLTQLTGHYSWAIAERLYGDPDYVFAMGRPETWPQELVTHALDWVVAYAPGVLHAKISKEAFVAAVEQLARVATALEAVAAWPAPDCASAWALEDPSKPPPAGGLRPPWRHLSSAVVPVGPSAEAMQCEWVGLFDPGCLIPVETHSGRPGRGMLALEFSHFLGREPEGWRGPRSETILRLGTDQAPEPVATSALDVPYDTLLTLGTRQKAELCNCTAYVATNASATPAEAPILTADDPGADPEIPASLFLKEHVFEANPARPRVLWLDRLVTLTGSPMALETRVREWGHKCRALRRWGV